MGPKKSNQHKKDVVENDTKFHHKAPRHQYHLPREQRGLGVNKYGGTQLTSFRGFRGQTYGPASRGRTYTKEERERYAREHGFDVE